MSEPLAAYLSLWQKAPLKRRSISTRLHGAATYKTVIFILATARTWYLTYKESDCVHCAGSSRKVFELKLILPYWQKPANGPHLEPVESNPQFHCTYLHFNSRPVYAYVSRVVSRSLHVFWTNAWSVFLNILIPRISPISIILFDVISVRVLDDEYKVCSFSMYQFLRTAVTSAFLQLDQFILLSTLSLNVLYLSFSLRTRD
jgi:hypothetical protein